MISLLRYSQLKGASLTEDGCCPGAAPAWPSEFKRGRPSTGDWVFSAWYNGLLTKICDNISESRSLAILGVRDAVVALASDY